MKYLYYTLLALFWGGSFLAINVSLTGFSPFLAATLRVSLAVLLTFIYILWKKPPFPKKSVTIQATLNGAVGIGIPWALLFWGEQVVPPAICSIINATSPIFTAVFAAIIIKTNSEKMTLNKMFGVLFGFIGIFIIFGPFAIKGPAENLWGLAAIIGMAFFYGLSIAWLKNFSDRISITMALFLECVGALGILIPITVVHGLTNYFVKDASLIKPAVAIFYLGFFSTTIAFILFYKLIKSSGSVQAASVTYLVPIVSILLDFIVLDKWVGYHAIVGIVIIFAALKIINKPIPEPVYECEAGN